MTALSLDSREAAADPERNQRLSDLLLEVGAGDSRSLGLHRVQR